MHGLFFETVIQKLLVFAAVLFTFRHEFNGSVQILFCVAENLHVYKQNARVKIVQIVIFGRIQLLRMSCNHAENFVAEFYLPKLFYVEIDDDVRIEINNFLNFFRENMRNKEPIKRGDCKARFYDVPQKFVYHLNSAGAKFFDVVKFYDRRKTHAFYLEQSW